MTSNKPWYNGKHYSLFFLKEGLVMIKKTRNFIILISIVFAFGIAFWIQQMRYAHMPEIPNVIIVGTSADYPPFSFKQDAKIIGFDIDVAMEAIKRLGKKTVIKDIPFELLIPQAMMGEVHIIAAGLSKTAEREQQVYFSKPYIIDNPLVILTSAKNPRINSLNDLIEKRIAVPAGHVADLYMSKLTHLAIDRVPTLANAIKALQSNKVDAIATELISVPKFLEENEQENFNVFIISESTETIALAISKMFPELAQKVSDALEQMHKDGTINQLQQKWNLT